MRSFFFPRLLSRQAGLTLVELMVALVLASLVMVGLYRTFVTMNTSHEVQQQIVELQQNLRTAVGLMHREIQMAGYDRTLARTAGVVTAAANDIRFTMNLNSDGDLADAGEDIRYTLNGTDLERNGEVVIGGVEVLDFVYLDAGGTATTTPAAVRSVQLAIVARSTNEDYAYTNTESYRNMQGTVILGPQNDNYRRRVLSTHILCRNLR